MLAALKNEPPAAVQEAAVLDRCSARQLGRDGGMAAAEQRNARLNQRARDAKLALDVEGPWHRLVARQDYGLQGWQRNKVFPDFFVMIRRAGENYTLTALETKGAHLIGNDDTAYKQRLFDLLTSHIANAQEAGQVLLTREGQPMTFKLLLDQTWQPEIQSLLAA